MTIAELQTINNDAWNALTAATTDQSSTFSTLTLSTVATRQSNTGQIQTATPQARLLVLRKAISHRQQLEFHTDIRSPKWFELLTNSAACITGYDPDQRLQLRLQGQITLFEPNTVENTTAWSALTHWTKNTYCSNTPGSALQAITNPPSPTDAADVAYGQKNFGVLIFEASSLDWFQLERGNNRRALFEYNKNDTAFSGSWITP